MADARHRSRHRPATERRSTAPAKIAVVVVVALLLAGGGYAAVTRLVGGKNAPSCAETTQLTVGTGALLTAPLTKVANVYNSHDHQVHGMCVEIKVETIDSGQTAQQIAAGWTEQQDGLAPDVWIPESKDWVAVARTTAAGQAMVSDDGAVVATSPVVLAMPRSMAVALGWPDRQLSWADFRANENSPSYWASHGHPEWGAFTVGFANPESSSAGLAAVLNVVASNIGQPSSALTPKQFSDDLGTKGALLSFDRQAGLITDTDTDLLSTYLGYGKSAPSRVSALVLPEALVYEANVGTPATAIADGQPAATVPLAAAYPADGLVVDEATYQPLRLTPGSERALAAADFLAELHGPEGQSILSSYGFRGPDRTNPKLTEQVGLVPTLRTEPPVVLNGGTINGAWRTFEGIHQRGNTLAVIDTSASMDEIVPNSHGKTRLEVAVAAANAAIPLFAKDSRLGLWQFSTRQNGALPYRELVPVGLMGEDLGGITREQALINGIDAMRARGGTGLYDTALAAFEALSAQYQPDKPNQVVLLTDGQDDDPSSVLTLDTLIAKLKAEYNPAKPVHIITIGYGSDADAGALSAIAAATGSHYYPAQDPNSIFQVFVNALTDR
jgi:Ca-activated chloride channel family protein